MAAANKAEDKKISLREREVHRYYQPWLNAHGSSLNVASHVESIAQHALHGQGFQPRTSRDKVLVAFAQLVVLRLNVKRGMVSLIDSTQQFILAEATRSSFTGKEDDIWLGSTILSRPDAVCEHCLYGSCTARDEDGQTWSCSGLVVDDCRLDDRFKDRPYVVQDGGGVRFYAGVPIVSRSGHMIGVYAVSDDKPRDGLRVDELKHMHEVAQAVMDHLEWARDRVDRFKGERIVRGMASFIEGTSTIHSRAAKERTSTASGSTNSPRMHPEDQPQPSESEPSAAQYSPAPPTVPAKDSLSKMYDRAAEILRESTIADGAVIFGANGSMSGAGGGMGAAADDDVSSNERSAPTSSGSDSIGHGSASDSDNRPSAQSCRLLALSLADDQARSGIGHKSALSIRTLEKYHTQFPRGKTFHFTEQGGGYSSGSDDNSSGTSDRESRRISRKGRVDHKQLLKRMPGAKSVTFLPLFDYVEDRLLAAVFVWTTATGRMMVDDDMAYLHAFGKSVVSEVARFNAQRNEAAKTTFIASMSHELRSPLHGILGATEFLMDTATDAYQSGLITSIMTCGKTLLDTLNHVLDYSKINKLSRTQRRRSAKHNKSVNLASESDSMNLTAEVDLGILVEEVVEAVTAGHAFKKQHGSALAAVSEESTASSVLGRPGFHKHGSSNKAYAQADEGTVIVLLDIQPGRSWLVRTQPGALRRIIMNLLGNALKYTAKGFVAVSLRGQENANSSKIDAFIRVVDSGKGISDDFLRNRLWVAFSQEDTFQPGTGLGLSIVKQIVDSLGGSVEVKSQQHVGTEFNVQLSLTSAESLPDKELRDQDVKSTADAVRGLHLVLLDPNGGANPPREPTHHISRLEETLVDTCAHWFDMRVTRSATMEGTDADIFLYAEPPSVDHLLQENDAGPRRSPTDRHIPMIIICVNTEEAIRVSQQQSQALTELGMIIEVIPQPCGPRKLAKVLNHCMRRVEEMGRRVPKGKEDPPSGLAEALPGGPGDDTGARPSAEMVERVKRSSSRDSSKSDGERHKVEEEQLDSQRDVPLSTAVSFPSASPSASTKPSSEDPAQSSNGPDTQDNASAPSAPKEKNGTPQAGAPPQEKNKPHVLLVDDNRINLNLLVMFMRKLHYNYAEAENGAEALESFKQACSPGELSSEQYHSGKRFDFVLMDISMPVMDGLEATRRIRAFEKENKMERTKIFTLTGLASAQAQKDAEAAGIDVFLPKPVKFAELKKLLATQG